MSFPTHRPRRLRRSEALRGLVRETRLATSGLIYPMFVCPGTKVRQEVSSMPGIYQQSVDEIVEECREVESLGIPGIILFGLPESKDPRGASSLSKEGVVQRAIEEIRKATRITVIAASSRMEKWPMMPRSRFLLSKRFRTRGLAPISSRRRT